MENNINILVDKLIKASPKQIKKMLSLCDGPEDIIHQYEASKVPEYNIIQLLCSWGGIKWILRIFLGF